MEENRQKRNESFQRWLHERQVFGQGMVMLLLLNSILLLGYVQVKHSGLGIILAAIGLIACGVMAGYFIPIQRRLGRMETELGFAADYGVRVGRRRMPWASLVLPLMFAPVWIYSLINSITYVRQ